MTITLEQLMKSDTTITLIELRNDSDTTPFAKLSLLLEWKNSYDDKLAFLNKVKELGGLGQFLSLIESLHNAIPVEERQDQLVEAKKLILALIDGLNWDLLTLHTPFLDLLQTVMTTANPHDDEIMQRAIAILTAQWSEHFINSDEAVRFNKREQLLLTYINFIEGLLSKRLEQDNLIELLNLLPKLYFMTPEFGEAYFKFANNLLQHRPNLSNEALGHLLSPIQYHSQWSLPILMDLFKERGWEFVGPYFIRFAKQLKSFIVEDCYYWSHITRVDLMIEMSKLKPSFLPVLHGALFPEDHHTYSFNNLTVLLREKGMEITFCLLVDCFIKTEEEGRKLDILELIFKAHASFTVRSKRCWTNPINSSIDLTSLNVKIGTFNFITDCEATLEFKQALIKLIESGIFQKPLHSGKAQQLAECRKSCVIAELLGERYNESDCHNILSPEERKEKLELIASGESPLRAFSDIRTTKCSWRENKPSRSSQMLKARADALDMNWVALGEGDRVLVSCASFMSGSAASSSSSPLPNAGIKR